MLYLKPANLDDIQQEYDVLTNFQFSRQKAHDFSQWDECRFLFLLDRFVADCLAFCGIILTEKSAYLCGISHV